MKFFNYFLWNQLSITLRRGHSFPRGHSRDSGGICLHFELLPPGSWIRSLPNHSFRLPAVILRFLLLVCTTISSLEIARNLVCTLNWPRSAVLVLLCGLSGTEPVTGWAVIEKHRTRSVPAGTWLMARPHVRDKNLEGSEENWGKCYWSICICQGCPARVHRLTVLADDRNKVVNHLLKNL